MMPTFCSLVPVKVVIMRNFNVTSADKVGIMTTLSWWCFICGLSAVDDHDTVDANSVCDPYAYNTEDDFMIFNRKHGDIKAMCCTKPCCLNLCRMCCAVSTEYYYQVLYDPNVGAVSMDLSTIFPSLIIDPSNLKNEDRCMLMEPEVRYVNRTRRSMTSPPVTSPRGLKPTFLSRRSSFFRDKNPYRRLDDRPAVDDSGEFGKWRFVFLFSLISISENVF